MRLPILLINILSLFEVIADYCLNFAHCVFEPPFNSFGPLMATYTVYLRLMGKLVLNFLFVLAELFSLGVTAQALCDVTI